MYFFYLDIFPAEFPIPHWTLIQLDGRTRSKIKNAFQKRCRGAHTRSTPRERLDGSGNVEKKLHKLNVPGEKSFVSQHFERARVYPEQSLGFVAIAGTRGDDRHRRNRPI
jgi:hypothetical protein